MEESVILPPPTLTEPPKPPKPPSPRSVQRVFIDFETTGFSFRSDEIIDIGFYHEHKSLNVLVRPSKPIPNRITQLTHITNHMVQKDGVEPKHACQLIWSYLHALEPFILIGHNIHVFDVPFLIRLFDRYGLLSLLERLECRGLIDTLRIFRTHREFPKKKLGILYQAIKKKKFTAHRAWNDSKAVSEIFFSSWFQQHHPDQGQAFLISWNSIIDTYWERYIRLSKFMEAKGHCVACDGAISPYFRHFHLKQEQQQ